MLVASMIYRHGFCFSIDPFILKLIMYSLFVHLISSLNVNIEFSQIMFVKLLGFNVGYGYCALVFRSSSHCNLLQIADLLGSTILRSF